MIQFTLDFSDISTHLNQCNFSKLSISATYTRYPSAAHRPRHRVLFMVSTSAHRTSDHLRNNVFILNGLAARTETISRLDLDNSRGTQTIHPRDPAPALPMRNPAKLARIGRRSSRSGGDGENGTCQRPLVQRRFRRGLHRSRQARGPPRSPGPRVKRAIPAIFAAPGSNPNERDQEPSSPGR